MLDLDMTLTRWTFATLSDTDSYFIAGILWTDVFASWIGNLTHWRVNLFLWAKCKLPRFIESFCFEYSSALLMIMSIEKCYALYFPFKAKVVCTVKTAKWVSGITAAIYAVFNSPLLVLVSPGEDEAAQGYMSLECVVRQDYRPITHHSFPLLYSFIPSLVMMVVNSAIVVKLFKAKCANTQRQGTESTNQALSKAAARGTAMLLIVSFTFIILTGPTAIILYFDLDLHIYATLVILLCSALNHAINAVLYCVVGARFRMELFGVVRFCKRRKWCDICVFLNVNPLTAGNLLSWENFLLPEFLRDSIVWRWTKFIVGLYWYYSTY